MLTLKHLPLALNPRAVSAAEGLRAGLAVAATLITGEVLGLPEFGLAALGALFTCFADPGGPLARRAPAVLIFGVLGGVDYGLFGLLRDTGVFLPAMLAGAVIFAGSFARVYGDGGVLVGNWLSAVTVLALDHPAGTIAHAAFLGFNFWVGALWAACVTLVIWRIRPFGPARRALGQVAESLGRLAAGLAGLAHEDETAEGFELHAAQDRRQVRETIEMARRVAMDTFRGRGVRTARAAQLSLRLETLEQIFGALIALCDTLESGPRERAAAARPLRLLAAWLETLGPELAADHRADTQKRQSALTHLERLVEEMPAGLPAVSMLMRVTSHLRALLSVTAPAEPAELGTAISLKILLLAPVRQNWSLKSEIMRHALRAGTVCAPLLMLSMQYGGPFAHWAAISLVLCLQPFFAGTWQRAAERMGGTLFGGLLAAGVGFLVHTKLDLAVAMLLLTSFAFSIRTVNFPLFVAALTPMIVLLIEQITPGADAMAVGAARVGYTLLGGALAVAANFLLWPRFEGTRLEEEIAKAVAAHAAYAQAVLDGERAGSALDAARRAAGLASNNLESALARALLEPHKGQDRLIERATMVDAALRRMAGRLTALAFERPALPPGLEGIWAHWLPARMSTPGLARPELPAGQAESAFERLAQQAELIGG